MPLPGNRARKLPDVRSIESVAQLLVRRLITDHNFRVCVLTPANCYNHSVEYGQRVCISIQ